MNSPELMLSPQRCFALQIHSTGSALFANVGISNVGLCRSCFKTFLNSIKLTTNLFIHESFATWSISQVSPQIFTVLNIDTSLSLERKLSEVTQRYM